MTYDPKQPRNKDGEWTDAGGGNRSIVRIVSSDHKNASSNIKGNDAGAKIMADFNAQKNAQDEANKAVFSSLADILNAPDRRTAREKLDERNKRIEDDVLAALKKQKEILDNKNIFKELVGPVAHPVLEKYSKGAISRQEALSAMAKDRGVIAEANASAKQQRRETDPWMKQGAWDPEGIAKSRIYGIDAASGNIDYRTGKYQRQGHTINALQDKMNVAGKTAADFKREAIKHQAQLDRYSSGKPYAIETGYKDRPKLSFHRDIRSDTASVRVNPARDKNGKLIIK